MKSIIHTIIFGVIASLFLTAAASAETRYAVACIKNETRSHMMFSWRFGEKASWRQVSLSPGEERIFSHKFDFVDENRSPRLYVSYDAKASGKYTENKVLDVYSSAGNSNCNQARRHAFRNESTDSNFITLYHMN